MRRFQFNCLCLFALIGLMVFGTSANAGCYSGRTSLGQRLAERRLERAEVQLERAEARLDRSEVKSNSCFDSASYVTSRVYVAPVETVETVVSKQSAKAEVCEKESCSKASESVTLKLLPAPVYSVAIPLQTLTTSVRTRTTVTGSGFQFFRAGNSCSSSGCK